MSHSLIHLHSLSLSFSHKVCFNDFSGHISYGDRIALIGMNGSGKSTLLKIIHGIFLPTSGQIEIPNTVRTGYVPQVIDDFASLSGGQRLNKVLTRVMRLEPNLLLLDEPTNHLDLSNRKSLIRRLNSYSGTLIFVSHDIELIQAWSHTLWHIDQGKIHIFSGNYDDYRSALDVKKTSLEHELAYLDRQQKETHYALMKEQKRAVKSRIKGEKSINQRKWPTIVSYAKARRAEETSGRKKANIHNKKEEVSKRLSELYLPEIISPKFCLNPADKNMKTLVSIREGNVGYEKGKILLHDFYFSIVTGERCAILGDNGSGKSTFIKAILGDQEVIKSGIWSIPLRQNIGYLDQHYETLSLHKSVLETIEEYTPTWSHEEIRCHLNDFLFRKNEEVNARVSTLSGGEKVRLILAQIAALPPNLLILDEITNNLDLITREHVIQVLRAYPGAMIVISHDEDFLKSIEITENYVIKNSRLERKSN